MHVCTLHWKELAAVRDQSRTVASALSPLRNIPLQFSWISQLSLGVCLVSTFNSSICAALCIAGVWVINPMWRQASHLCSWAWPSLFPNRSFHDFSLYSLSWSDILITQWVKKKDAGVTPQKYHICTATQNSVLLGQFMPGLGPHSPGEPSSSLPVLRARSCYQTSYCGSIGIFSEKE